MPPTQTVNQTVSPNTAAAAADLRRGATVTGAVTRFCLWSSAATAVELCLIDGDPQRDPGRTTERRTAMQRGADDLWQVDLAAGPGQRYGYRVHGPWNPADGARCNPAKLLVDPYARAVELPADPCFPARPELVDSDPDDPKSADHRDSLLYAPWSVVVDPTAQRRSTRPRTPMSRSVIYEAHVHQLTAALPEVPEAIRGTYAALGHPALIEHLRGLGVTTLELLPIHQSVSEPQLTRRGMTNAWGYNTLSYFAPHAAYCHARTAAAQVDELVEAVAALHDADIEVLLDVVFNHTAEGPLGGPTYHLRGIDNAAYYKLAAPDRGAYADHTGCGNTLDAGHPAAIGLVLASLRYWAETFDIDGYRFDLATSLGRTDRDFDPAAPLLRAIESDPLLSSLKLIAEPWDVGPGGYQLGSFATPTSTPAPDTDHDAEVKVWSEWNDRYRDDVRDFWRGHGNGVRAIAKAVAGSSDIFQHSGRPPSASVNFLTAHDGFTLRDLVSYDRKHNEANGEDNRDGTDNNRSWNSGHEGESDDPLIEALRLRRQASLLSTLYLSLGTPMITAGDELSRTQGGNNNPYCQDGPQTSLPWQPTAAGRILTRLAGRLATIRSEHSLLQADTFLTGRPPAGAASHHPPDVRWLDDAGQVLTEEQWNDTGRCILGVLLTAPPSAQGQQSRLLLWLNGGGRSGRVRMPEDLGVAEWTVLVDTAELDEPMRGLDPRIAIGADIGIAEYGFLALTG